MSNYTINEDIKKAETLPSSFYGNTDSFKELTDVLLSNSWQFIGDETLFSKGFNIVPITLCEGIINEPLVLIRNESNDITCLSNVCTHRGNLLLQKETTSSQLVCGYHGRKFSLDGKMTFMPEFEKAQDFPRNCDHLTSIPIAKWQQFFFVSLNPNFDFNIMARDLDERLSFIDFSQLEYIPEHDKSYKLKAHWALYCDNYLEGFHIPFVHPGLNQAVEYSSYKTVLYQYCNLQIGYAKDGIEAFELPEGHPDFGKNVAAYYYWIFPNLMLNFYPWGLSINMVNPKSQSETEIVYKTYVMDQSKFEKSAGAALNEVELEDGAIVESVHVGMKSRFYKTGRFSPTREAGVHHFHRLIADCLNTTP